jgi:hypothetical protein
MTSRCEHSGLLPDQCGHCQGTDRPAPKPVAERQIEARYPGACPECFGAIEPGDTIRLFSDQGRAKPEWYCADCMAPPPIP